jgi:hypothetical protein
VKLVDAEVYDACASASMRPDLKTDAPRME